MDDYYGMLRDYVKTSLVVVYGQSWCPHCQAARKTLGKRGVYVEMASFESGISKQHKRVLKDLLENDGGIPIIFVGQKRIANQDLDKHLGVSRKRRLQTKKSIEEENEEHEEEEQEEEQEQEEEEEEEQEEQEEEQEQEEEEEKPIRHATNKSNSTKRKRFGKMPSLADQLRAAAKPK
jgi:glutaredoxin